MDWFARGLPREGKGTGEPRAGDAARKDVPRCRLDDRRHEVAVRVRAAGWDLSVVVDDEDVVLGLLESAALDGDPDTPVEAAMRAAPTTMRPHVTLHDAAEFLTSHERQHVLITTSDGRLIGLLSRADTKRSRTR
jgi:CBS domain-containing protein